MSPKPSLVRRILKEALVILIIALAILALLGVPMLIAELRYGDWTCAFAHCVKVKP